ncbi:MAG: chromate efflux transporter [Chitinophagales bacterium]|nr:chromate efflux transporter [Chitinophagales bacterium]
MSATTSLSFGQLFGRFLRFGCLAWGGPVAQIAMLKRELVEEERWISPEHFNRVLAVFQALPGPEAHELCVYFGYRAHGRWGGLLAGLGFMLPGFALMLCATALYTRYGISPALAEAFAAAQTVVIALIIWGVYKIGKHSLHDKASIAIATWAAITCYAGWNFGAVLLLAGGLYALYHQTRLRYFVALLALLTLPLGYTLYKQPPAMFNDTSMPAAMPAPASVSPAGYSLSNLGAVFWTGLKGGLLTFGGAYTAIPFVAADAVGQRAWLSRAQFLDGIALANLLPAPLVIFVTFVGYFGAGWHGAWLITLGMFLPAFMFTLLGFSTVERLIAYRPLHAFLDGIAAAVTGIIALTAAQLAADTLSQPCQWLICLLSIGLLYRFSAKWLSAALLCGAGLAGYLLDAC